jgi:hypothetical protein
MSFAVKLHRSHAPGIHPVFRVKETALKVPRALDKIKFKHAFIYVETVIILQTDFIIKLN